MQSPIDAVKETLDVEIHDEWLSYSTILPSVCGRCSCDAYAESRAGRHVIEVLQEFLTHADFVVVVITAEDATAGGSTRARQNVVH
jgi:hypothetical protein